MARPRKKSPTVDDKPKTGRAARATTYRRVFTSGLFGLPGNAVSVDWMVVNHSPHPQTFRITVFKAGVGPKSAIAPGPLVMTLAPDEVTHNANSVAPGQPFQHGFYYEVVLEANSRRLLPSVHIWEDLGNTVIPGTLISPGTFVEV